MKTKIFSVAGSILIGAALFFGVVSCQKSKPVGTLESTNNETINSPTSSVNESVPMARLSGTCYCCNYCKYFVDNGGNDWYCTGSGSNCLPEVIVTSVAGWPSGFEEILFNGSQEEKQALFSDNAEFFSFFDETLTTYVIRGEWTYEVRVNESNVYCFIFRLVSDPERIAYVSPVSFG